jgi:GDPmannose 4,6-dehydratase
MKRALITGVTGQDGTYLSELLLSKGYEVHGIVRRSSSSNTVRINHLLKNWSDANKFIVHYGDVTDGTNIMRLIAQIKPDEIYNLAAQSHVAVSFETPEYTAQADALGTLRILEAIKIAGLAGTTKFYQASTSELFGNGAQVPQSEATPFRPCSPYAVAKLYAYWITVNYRHAYNIFACNGILFNHESPLRGHTFVTRKITRAVAHIKHGIHQILHLGNLDAKRDWGYAPDYVDAMWRMMNHTVPLDLVIATGTTYSVRQFVERAFAEIGIAIAWEGTGSNERGIDAKTGNVLVCVDPQFFRPTDVDLLIGDARKARTELGWQPQVQFDQLVRIMVQADVQEVARELGKHVMHYDGVSVCHKESVRRPVV